MLQQLSLFDNIAAAPVFPSTRYQGSKSKYVDWIEYCLKDIPFKSVLDAFGGTGSVAYKFKQQGKSVTYNDILPFNAIIGKALIENKEYRLDDWEVDYILSKQDKKYSTFLEDTFRDIYYTDEENRWLDMVSANIRAMENPYKQAVAYFALFQSCIIKRPYNLFHRKNLYVRTNDVERSFGNKKTWDTPFDVHFRHFVQEANNAIFDNGQSCLSMNKDASSIKDSYDLVYIDTPYISDAGVGVDYADFYHFLNGLVYYEQWGDLIDYRSKHLRLKRNPSVWTDANTITSAFQSLFKNFPNSILAISYRNNGIPSIEELVEMLKNMGRDVHVEYSSTMRYALSKRASNEVLIIAK